MLLAGEQKRHHTAKTTRWNNPTASIYLEWLWIRWLVFNAIFSTQTGYSVPQEHEMYRVGPGYKPNTQQNKETIH